MNTDLMFSSKDQTWETPIDFFNLINEEFNFNLDVCAEEETAKCKNFFTKEIMRLTINGREFVIWTLPMGEKLESG